MKKAKIISAVGAVAIMALVPGCMLGPDFDSAPPADLPVGFHGVAAGDVAQAWAEKSAAAEKYEWWGRFDDPTLLALLQRGETNSLTLRQAVQRVRQSRAAARQASASLMPSASASARESSSKTWNPDESSNGASAGLDASWELDFFGGARRSREASFAELEASGYSLEDAKVSLSAEIATEYIQLRKLQADLGALRGNLAIQEDSAKVARSKSESGFATGLDAYSADAQIESIKAQIPQAEASITSAIRKLELLVGAYSGTLDGLLAEESPIPSAPHIEVGVPSELLERRPDIRKASADLHAATARIGVAEADRFPKVTIGGSATITASSLGDWGDALRAIGLAPSISLPVYSGGAKKAKVEQYKAAAEESALAYRSAVIAAISEVETACSDLAMERARGEALDKNLELCKKSVAVSERLYNAGEIEYIDLLNYRKMQISSEQAINQHRASLAELSVKLYKALGGSF